MQQISMDLQSRESRTANETGPPLMRTIFREMEHWLDRAENNTLLSEPCIADIVTEAVQHRVETNRWQVFEYVTMSNHIHFFMSVMQGTLEESIEDFRRWTGHQASKQIELPNGRFWQDEWFDHWSRSDEQDERIMRYIQNNPVTAGLVKIFHDWKYGGWSKPIRLAEEGFRRQVNR